MVRITKVHTGGGDAGETSLLTGERVSKAHPRVGVYGGIDELNSIIGLVAMEMDRLPRHHQDGGERATVRSVRREVGPALQRVQQELFDLGAELSGTPGGLPDEMGVLTQAHANRLVEEMNRWCEDLAPIDSFLLPGGSPVVATMHLARSVARRCEREACALRESDGDEAIRAEVIAYLNRLSDWFFVLSRWCTSTLGDAEILWTPVRARD